MSENFEEIISQMLNAYMEGMSVEEIVSNQIKIEGLSDSQSIEVNEAVNFQNMLSNSYDDLQKAKAEGESREDWLTDRLEKRFSGMTSEQRDIALEAMQKAMIDNSSLQRE